MRLPVPLAACRGFAMLAVAALPLGAQLAVQGGDRCFAPAVGGAGRDGVVESAQDLQRERLRAVAEIDSGFVAFGVERLERLLAVEGETAPGSGEILAELAFAYQRLGCREAFLATGERAIRAQAGVRFVELFRARAQVAAAQRLDSTVIGSMVVARDDSVREGVLADHAWSQYRGGRMREAARAFEQLAAAAPGLGARLDARLMAAQSLMELGDAGGAVSAFRAVSDSARLARSALGGRIAEWAVAMGSLLAARRDAALLWAPDVRDGRLLVATPDSGGHQTVLRAVQSADITRRLDAMGDLAMEMPLRAVVWTGAPEGMHALREGIDSLALADVRALRADARMRLLAGQRAERLDAAARYKARVSAAAADLRPFDAQLAAFDDSLVKQDSAVAAATRHYRQTVLDKIGDIRALGAANRSAIDSVAASAGSAATAARLTGDERSAVAYYLAVADAAAGALETGLKRLPVVFLRDSAHAKAERLRSSLAAAHRSYDSALVAAAADERQVASEVDARLADATVEAGTAGVARSAVEALVAGAAASVLRARATALDAQLRRAEAAADFGAGSAAFFHALAEDSARAGDRRTVVARDSAITGLEGALQRHAVSPLRARARVQLGELYARRADAAFASAQRANALADHPDYAPAIAMLDSLLAEFPADPEADAAAYTLGSLAFQSQRYEDALRAFERVMAAEGSPFRAEAFFRAGDARFEMASRQGVESRRSQLGQAAQLYERAIALAPADGDIHFLALYKLGWSNYAQADRQNSEEYRRAVEVFARLVREADALPADRQARLALRQEAIDYLAIAITQLGGADEAVRSLALLPEPATRLIVLRRLARALRDQGEFASAAIAYRGVLGEQPDEAGALDTRLALVDLYQNRMLEPSRAQEARLQLVEALAPGGPWGRANPGRSGDAAVARERALRESGAYALGEARKSLAHGPAAASAGAPGFAMAAELAERYLGEFAGADSARRVSLLGAEALFAAGEFRRSGARFSRTAATWPLDSALAGVARRNAIVAFDSALAHSPRDEALQDSLFTAIDRFTALASDADARAATISKGRRAAEGKRWSMMAATFAAFASRWPADPAAVEARKLVGDARYRMGEYRAAQQEWLAAQRLATQAGRRTLADSIADVRLSAAVQAADSLARAGQYVRAADDVYAPLAADIGDPVRAADMLRGAIEMYLAADSSARARDDRAGSLAARERAVAAIQQLAVAAPSYRHTATYRALRAQLLGDLGRPAETVTALEELVRSVPAWPGRADAMVRVAVLLDSLGRRAEAAAAYEQFSVAYPGDPRAADAQFNAAVVAGQVPDRAASARAYAAFVARFPRDPRVGAAQRARLDELRAGGDSATAVAEMARLCAKPGEALAADCADRNGAAAFHEGMAGWDRFVAMTLAIRSRAQLTRVGVETASEQKMLALRRLTGLYARSIASGSPEWVAAGTFQTGLAQWYYGLFLRDVQLPADLTEAQRDAARRGAALQAKAYFDLAEKSWTALVTKADAEKFNNPWVARARGALAGTGIPSREAQ